MASILRRLIPTAIFLLLFWILRVSLLTPFEPKPFLFWTLNFVLALPFLAQAWMIFIFFQAGEADELKFEAELKVLAYFSMGLMSFLLTFALVKDLYNLIAPLLFHGSDLIQSETSSAVILALSLVFLIFGYANAKFIIKTPIVPFYFDHLDAALEGYHIVHLSDVHFGSGPNLKQIQKILSRAQNLKSDLIVITGDLIDGSISAIQGELKALNEITARDGVFFVYGNHEYYWNAELIRQALEKTKIQILKNTSKTITVRDSRLQIAGMDDPAAKHFQGEGPVAPPIDTTANFKLMLAHQPSTHRLAAEAGYDLQLSGHTHGGQFFPWNFFVKLMYPVSGGSGQLKNTQIYVSHGTGFWGPPIRLGTFCEITQIELRRTKHHAPN